MQTKEMERIEQQHGGRMDKIEKSVESLNEKMDALSDKVDKKMDSLAESIRERNEKHAIDLAIIKTKLAFYAAIAGVRSLSAYSATGTVTSDIGARLRALR